MSDSGTQYAEMALRDHARWKAFDDAIATILASLTAAGIDATTEREVESSAERAVRCVNLLAGRFADALNCGYHHPHMGACNHAENERKAE